MLFSRAVLAGCLAGLKWLLWLVAGLVAVLVTVRALGPEPLDPAPLLGIIGISGLGGVACGAMARLVTRGG